MNSLSTDLGLAPLNQLGPIIVSCRITTSACAERPVYRQPCILEAATISVGIPNVLRLLPTTTFGVVL